MKIRSVFTSVVTMTFFFVMAAMASAQTYKMTTPMAPGVAVPDKVKTAIVVNVDNFDRAQTDFEYAGIVKQAGGINKVHSNRAPTPIDKQNIIRMNRDTL